MLNRIFYLHKFHIAILPADWSKKWITQVQSLYFCYGSSYSIHQAVHSEKIPFHFLRRKISTVSW